MGSGCGSVGRAVASNTRGQRFEPRHRQIFTDHLITVNCIEKTKRKRGQEWPILKKRGITFWDGVIKRDHFTYKL